MLMCRARHHTGADSLQDRFSPHDSPRGYPEMRTERTGVRPQRRQVCQVRASTIPQRDDTTLLHKAQYRDTTHNTATQSKVFWFLFAHWSADSAGASMPRAFSEEKENSEDVEEKEYVKENESSR